MSYPRFLLDDTLGGPGEYSLNAQESHHAFNVLRLRQGDVIIAFDGNGQHAEAIVVDASRSAVRVRVDDVHRDERLPLELTIVTALPKGKRWQSLVEKCTELGVDRIIPLLSERSVVKGEGDADKWRRWAIEAAKQSRRSWIPEIDEPMRLAAALALSREVGAFLLLADPDGENPSSFRGMLGDVSRIMVVVGPEGGFTDEELAKCREYGAKAIRLSPFTLRIETAATAVCAILREIL